MICNFERSEKRSACPNTPYHNLCVKQQRRIMSQPYSGKRMHEFAQKSFYDDPLNSHTTKLANRPMSSSSGRGKGKGLACAPDYENDHQQIYRKAHTHTHTQKHVYTCIQNLYVNKQKKITEKIRRTVPSANELTVQQLQQCTHICTYLCMQISVLCTIYAYLLLSIL